MQNSKNTKVQDGNELRERAKEERFMELINFINYRACNAFEPSRELLHNIGRTIYPSNLPYIYIYDNRIVIKDRDGNENGMQCNVRHSSQTGAFHFEQNGVNYTIKTDDIKRIYAQCLQAFNSSTIHKEDLMHVIIQQINTAMEQRYNKAKEKSTPDQRRRVEINEITHDIDVESNNAKRALINYITNIDNKQLKQLLEELPQTVNRNSNMHSHVEKINKLETKLLAVQNNTSQASASLLNADNIANNKENTSQFEASEEKVVKVKESRGCFTRIANNLKSCFGF